MHRPRLASAAWLLLAAAAPSFGDVDSPDAFKTGDEVRITLANGDHITGTFAAQNAHDGSITLNHPTLGALTLPKEAVAAIVAAAAGSPAAASGEVAPAPVQPAEPVPPPPPPPPPPDPTSWLDGWKYSAELGLNGSDGNTQRVSMRAGFGGERKTSKTETTIKFAYSYATEDSSTTENKFTADLRNDWLTNSRWRYFATGKYEYDDFQDWTHRISGFVGVGYEFIKNDKTLLIGRLGIGGSKEIGGDENKFRPELDLGVDYKYTIDDRQSIFATADYYPDLSEFTTYRIVAKAGYQIIVNPESNMSLKLGVEDRYDSDVPTGTKKNDIDYFALLVWSF